VGWGNRLQREQVNVKKTYQIKGFTGKTFQRTTERDYSHAVVADEHPERGEGICFCGSMKLAKSKAGSMTAYDGRKRTIYELEIIK